MFEIMQKVLGIITARGGSKGIPGKNVKLLLGKPLIAYTIEAAKQSGVFDRIVVSTDDKLIADVARQYNCEVPFMRPKRLASDKTAHLPVIQHAVSTLRERDGYKPDYTMILQPTSPLRQAFHIKEAVELALKEKPDSVISVASIADNLSPLKAMIQDRFGYLKLVNGKPVSERISRRQDLLQTYWSVGAMYLFKTKLLFHKKHPNFYGRKVLPYVMENCYLIDINIPEDWEAAERALEKLLLK